MLYALLIVAAACDLLTTEFALRYHKARELNPLMQTRRRRLVLKSAATALLIVVAYMVPAARAALLITGSVVWLGAAIWNVTQVSARWK